MDICSRCDVTNSCAKFGCSEYHSAISEDDIIKISGRFVCIFIEFRGVLSTALFILYIVRLYFQIVKWICSPLSSLHTSTNKFYHLLKILSGVPALNEIKLMRKNKLLLKKRKNSYINIR